MDEIKNDNTPNYYAVIPANVRYDKKLSCGARLLYGEISALCNKKGFCWANNSYFEELYEVSKRTIQNWITDLINNGYIYCNFRYGDNGKTIIARCLSIVQLHEDMQIISYPSAENCTPPRAENCTYNNTSINTTSNNKERKTSYGVLIETYTQDSTLTEAIYEFIKMRKFIKKPLTDKGLKLNLNKLNKLAKTDSEKVEILEQSIANCYQGVFPLKSDCENTTKFTNRTGTTRDL